MFQSKSHAAKFMLTVILVQFETTIKVEWFTQHKKDEVYLEQKGKECLSFLFLFYCFSFKIW